jgi:hypothetical protein
MEFWVRVLPRLVSAIMSILDASSLRERMYRQHEEHELMWTALDDIKRMYPNHPVSDIASRTLDKVTVKYGRE